ncbi:MAG TPA: hypothetical protein VIL74_25410 [Pyrinomonadaceae bacterium]|jgi:hypothetical protein
MKREIKTESGKRKAENYNNSIFRFSAAWRLGVLMLLFAFAVGAQDLPDEIRGYKVHKAKISVTNKAAPSKERDDSEAYARLTEPELVETSLTGLTFEISAEIEPLDHRGKIDFLMFRNFKVNGLEVEIEEYAAAFELDKGRAIALPKPVKIFLGAGQALKGALGELRDSREEWTVTGTVFVFGRFKKWGFTAKRVVPVEVDVKIKNPLRRENALFVKAPSF